MEQYYNLLCESCHRISIIKMLYKDNKLQILKRCKCNNKEIISDFDSFINKEKKSNKRNYCESCYRHNKSKTKTDIYCIKCNEWMCEHCIKMNKDTHSKSSFKMTIEYHCNKHETNDVLYYCLICEEIFCSLCLNYHQQHKYININEFYYSDIISKRMKEYPAHKVKVDKYHTSLKEDLLKRIESIEEKEILLSRLSKTFNHHIEINAQIDTILNLLFELYMLLSEMNMSKNYQLIVNIVNNTYYNNELFEEEDMLENSYDDCLSTLIQLSHYYNDNSYIYLSNLKEGLMKAIPLKNIKEKFELINSVSSTVISDYKIKYILTLNNGKILIVYSTLLAILNPFTLEVESSFSFSFLTKFNYVSIIKMLQYPLSCTNKDLIAYCITNSNIMNIVSIKDNQLKTVKAIELKYDIKDFVILSNGNLIIVNDIVSVFNEQWELLSTFNIKNKTKIFAMPSCFIFTDGWHLYIYDKDLRYNKGEVIAHNCCKIDNERIINGIGGQMTIINVVSCQVETTIHINDCSMFEANELAHNKGYIVFCSKGKKIIIMKWSEPEKKKYTYYDNEEQYREKVHYAEMSNGFLIYADIYNNIYVINI